MDEPVIEPGQEAEPEGVETPPAKPARDWESEARSMGWNPDYDGPNAVEDPKEFVQRKPLYDGIKAARQEVKDLRSALLQERTLRERTAQVEREKMAKVLQKDRIKAIQDGDAEKVLEIEEQISSLKTQANPEQTAPVDAQLAYRDWVSRNSWFDTDPELKFLATGVAAELRNTDGHLDPMSFYDKVAEKVKALRPEKFNDARNDPAAVSPKGTPPARRRNQDPDISKLNSEQKRAVHAMIRAGAYAGKSEKDALREYARELQELGVI